MYVSYLSSWVIKWVKFLMAILERVLSISRDGILKYLPPLLPVEGPEIRLHGRSIPIEILS
jgi:hypothetical protein